MAKKSFFSRFKNSAFFKENLGGRYVAAILMELIQDNPGMLSALFPKYPGFRKRVGKDYSTECEKPEFQVRINKKTSKPTTKHDSGNKDRRADGSIRNKDGDLVALIEVKYGDEKKSEHTAQLSDYCEYIKENDREIRLLYLTQYLPQPEDNTTLGYYKERHEIRAQHLTFSELHKIISQLSNNHKTISQLSNNSVIKSFADFLEEEGGVLMPIDKKAIRFYMLRSTNVYSGAGSMQGKDLIAQIPPMLENLFNNIIILADEVESKMIKTIKDKRYSYTRTYDFNILPHLDPKITAKLIDEEEDYFAVPHDRKIVNKIDFYCLCRMNFGGPDSEKRFFTIGYKFELIPVPKREASPYLFSRWRIEDEETEEIRFGVKEDIERKKAVQVVKKALGKAMKTDPAQRIIRDLHSCL